MTLDEVLISLLLGVISGIVSGLIVIYFYSVRDWKKQFLNEQQMLSRNIELICYDLKLLFKDKKTEITYIQQLILDSPMTPAFNSKRTKKADRYTIREIRRLLEELQDFFFLIDCYDNSLYKDKMTKYESELFHLRQKLLKARPESY